jgi:hypothetical protein
MPREMQIDNLRMGIPPLRNWDSPIQLYHDETNNIRRLSLGEVGLNVQNNKTFVIGGVALMPEKKIVEWKRLRELLNMQPSATEIKFEHLAKGSYEDALCSHKIATFLQWLLDRDIMIHYSALDPLYWSILDIIESLQTDHRIQINEYHMELKTELHHAVVQNLTGFLALLHSFDYPNLRRDQVRPFLEAVLEFVERYVPEDRSAATLLLKRTLRHATRLPKLELPFLHDNKSGELIADFSVHFMHCIYVFKNASHVFDKETFIEKIFEKFELREGNRRLDYRFANSKEEEGIQLADVVVGLVGRHFSYLQDHSLTELMQRRASFNKVQLGNLDKLHELIDRSDNFSNGLFHVVMPFDTQFKNNAFLHEIEVPPFMWQ